MISTSDAISSGTNDRWKVASQRRRRRGGGGGGSGSSSRPYVDLISLALPHVWRRVGGKGAVPPPHPERALLDQHGCAVGPDINQLRNEVRVARCNKPPATSQPASQRASRQVSDIGWIRRSSRASGTQRPRPRAVQNGCGRHRPVVKAWLPPPPLAARTVRNHCVHCVGSSRNLRARNHAVTHVCTTAIAVLSRKRTVGRHLKRRCDIAENRHRHLHAKVNKNSFSIEVSLPYTRPEPVWGNRRFSAENDFVFKRERFSPILGTHLEWFASVSQDIRAGRVDACLIKPLDLGETATDATTDAII